MVRGRERHCQCCGKPWSMSDCIGPTCNCMRGEFGLGRGWCKDCGKCPDHCDCPEGVARDWEEVNRRAAAGTLSQSRIPPELVDTAHPASPPGKPGATGPESPDWSTDADLLAIGRLADAATAGPWVAAQWEMTLTDAGREQFPAGFGPDFAPWVVLTVHIHPQLEGPEVITNIATHAFEEPRHTPWVRQEDAAFIAASREAVPRLVAEVRALRVFRDAIDRARVAYHAGAGTVGRMTLPDVALAAAVEAAQDALHAAHAADRGDGGAHDREG